jgi:outer membrane receptor for Fe3+-dicitrate
MTYSAGQFYVSGTGIYGSGLTNGVTPDSIGDRGYCTGLFCFNDQFKVKPSFITNFSAGYSFIVGRTVVRPEVFIDNAFDNQYLLKGAFFSGAYAGRPRTVQVRMNIGV